MSGIFGEIYFSLRIKWIQQANSVKVYQMTETHLRFCYDDGYYWALKCMCSCVDGVSVVRVRYIAFRLTF